MSDPRIKQIKIKTGVVKRQAKEKEMYEKEVTSQGEKVKKMKDEGADEYDIRKQEEVLQESCMMIPDTKRRLKASYNDLKVLLEKDSDLAETEEYVEAKKMLEATSKAVE